MLGRPLSAALEPSVVFAFGTDRLRLDRVPGLSPPELWLELTVNDRSKTPKHLAQAGVVRRGEIEALAAGFDGLWISSPASVIHLVCGPGCG